jgi:hypothetical protein
MLRISGFSNDLTPLSGMGTLFQLRMIRSGTANRATPLLWANPPDELFFIDADLHERKPGNLTPGSIAPSQTH